MEIYTYVVPRDYGFAPNPFFGVCTLATCKPKIRKGARKGDWIVGTGAKLKNNDRRGYIVYAMEVNEILDFDAYWNDARFSQKKPNSASPGLMFWVGDNIYHRGHNEEWIQEDSHHSHPGGLLNEKNLFTDTQRTQNVLIGSNFSYWGGHGPKVPSQFRNFHGSDIVCPGRDHRRTFPEGLKKAFVEWLNTHEKGYISEPLQFQYYGLGRF